LNVRGFQAKCYLILIKTLRLGCLFVGYTYSTIFVKEFIFFPVIAVEKGYLDLFHKSAKALFDKNVIF
jgi:hypothetical protein